VCARRPCALRPRRCVLCVCMLGVGVSAGAESVGAPGSYQAAPLRLAPPLRWNLNAPTHCTARFTGTSGPQPSWLGHGPKVTEARESRIQPLG